MPISQSIDASRVLTIFTVNGMMTFEEQMGAIKSFYDGKPTPNVLWDFRSMEGSRITSDELYEIVSYIEKHKDKRPQGKTALVSATEIDYGISRASEIYSEVKALPWSIRALRSFYEAIIWIDGDAD